MLYLIKWTIFKGIRVKKLKQFSGILLIVCPCDEYAGQRLRRVIYSRMYRSSRDFC